MAEFVGSRASFWVQSNALLRKNLTFQKRRMCANIALILIPAFFCIFFAVIQFLIDNKMVAIVITQCEKGQRLLGPETQIAQQCAITSPPEWPPLVRLPGAPARSLRSDYPNPEPDEECWLRGTCPVTILITGNNQTFGQELGSNMLPAGDLPKNSSGNLTDWTKFVVGSHYDVSQFYMDPAFELDRRTFYLQNQCNDDEDRVISAPVQVLANNRPLEMEVECLPCFILWRNSYSEINDELFKGQRKGNKHSEANETLSAYDISNSDENTYNVTIWYDSNQGDNQNLKRIPRLVNMVVLASLVYEKQERLRVMMKMHGLGDGPYWMIQYSYFLAISVLYIICFVGFGSLVGLHFFYEHDYSLQFIFYFFFVNLQIALAFLLSSMFSHTRAATVVAYLFVFGSGLLGSSFFATLLDGDQTVSKAWIILLELYPGFSLYRGLYEFGQYTSEAKITKTGGMGWGNLNDSANGMRDVLTIMPLEWAVLLLLAFYIDQVVTCGKSPLFFLPRKKAPAFQITSMERHGSKGFGDMEKPDVAQEKEKVEKLMEEAKYTSHVVICDNIKKVYPGRDGNPEKFAVRGLSLALPQGECFGMLGPSGAGKTSFIEMMIGLAKPTTGTAYVQGLDLVTQMNEIYSCIGVCPQHDLLWATLTGREHLLFYGRLKNLKGSDLTKAVEDSLKSLNLFNGGVADKRAGQYSGGMKRRLSVAISLIGNPIAVYMDEPSTGLDPASRNTLWNVVKLAKQGRVIILTTHSMEEAEFLCDRIGIFVDGRLQCIGNPKELKGRYGGSYVFTITTDSCHDQEVESLVQRLAPNANRVYHLAGTQKFEFPKSEVRIADVFQTVEHVKKMFTVYAWGLADTTLEDVFIKVASAPKKLESNVLSRDNLIE
ncbi:ABC transporter A family member 7 [Rosa sericea]